MLFGNACNKLSFKAKLKCPARQQNRNVLIRGLDPLTSKVVTIIAPGMIRSVFGSFLFDLFGGHHLSLFGLSMKNLEV
jgi:hypothetical protein